MTLSEKIILLRKAKSLSQSELAEKMKISEEELSSYESGKSDPPPNRLLDLATALGVSTDTLLKKEIKLEVKEMDATINNNSALVGGFVAYEYFQVSTTKNNENLYCDSYSNFGWEKTGVQDSVLGFSGITLKFKRNRKIKNRTELNSLQRKFEIALKEIEKAEKEKTSTASAVSIVSGIVGTGFMAGATFSYLASLIGVMIPLAVVGFAFWGTSYFIYKAIKAKKTIKCSQIIDKLYDSVYLLSEQAVALLK